MNKLTQLDLPYKSVAGALLLSLMFGPVGLLYASWWVGLLLMPFTIFVLVNQWLFLTLLIWLFSCIWSVRAVELHNKKIYHSILSNTA